MSRPCKSCGRRDCTIAARDRLLTKVVVGFVVFTATLLALLVMAPAWWSR